MFPSVVVVHRPAPRIARADKIDPGDWGLVEVQRGSGNQEPTTAGLDDGIPILQFRLVTQ